MNEKGLSLVESVAAIMIISFSVIGLCYAFIYGRFNVEKAGVERKALELLNGQMDYWKNVRERTTESEPLDVKSGTRSSQTVKIDTQKDLSGALTTEISGVIKDGNLSYQNVTVKLIYNNGIFKDSLGLSSKMYLR
ncbi:MAG: hypothetical protein JNL74_03120 [Fibrobacteres bacterium]|nr:hypothetical protein [Fibrobacterota bacterium]